MQKNIFRIFVFFLNQTLLLCWGVFCIHHRNKYANFQEKKSLRRFLEKSSKLFIVVTLLVLNYELLRVKYKLAHELYTIAEIEEWLNHQKKAPLEPLQLLSVKNHNKNNNKRQFVNCIAKIRCDAVSKNLRGVPSKRCKGGKKSEVGLDLVSVPKEV